LRRWRKRCVLLLLIVAATNAKKPHWSPALRWRGKMA